MSTFRLSAGCPVPRFTRDGAAASAPEGAARGWAPNQEKDSLLGCGCTIPWPVLALRNTGGKIVKCDIHGWQDVTTAEITRAKRDLRRKGLESCTESQRLLPDIPPF